MAYDDYDYSDDRDYDRDDRPSRRTVYRCGGYASYTGHCGGYDCETCHPGNREGEPRDSALASRMDAAGYTYDEGTWEKRMSTRTHTARRDHKDGRIKAGQKYTVTRFRCVDEDGGSRHRHSKRVLSR
jgi:hypothetical protein